MKKSIFAIVAAVLALALVGCANDTAEENFLNSVASREFTVTFNANGGTCDTSKLKVKAGTTIPANEIPTANHASLIFAGWNTKDDGSGTMLTASTEIGDSVTYYAYFVNDFITKASFNQSSISVVSDETITLTGTYWPALSTENLNLIPSDDKALICSITNKNNGTFTATITGGLLGTFGIRILSASGKKVVGESQVTVTAPAASSITTFSTIPTTTYSSSTDFTVATLTNDVPVAYYALSLTAGKKIRFIFTDSDYYYGIPGLADCSFILFDSNFEKVVISDGGRRNFIPSLDGTYYLAIVRNSEIYNYPCKGGFYAYESEPSVVEQQIYSIPDGTTSTVTVTGNLTANDITELRDALLSLTGTTKKAILDFSNATFPDNKVPEYAFYYNSNGCTNFVGVTLPNTITEIGAYAFEKSGLTTVTIPDTVTKLTRSFAYCTSLTTVYLGSGIEELRDYNGYGVFDSGDVLTDVYYSGTPEQWAAVVKDLYYKWGQNATIHFKDGTTADF